MQQEMQHKQRQAARILKAKAEEEAIKVTMNLWPRCLALQSAVITPASATLQHPDACNLHEAKCMQPAQCKVLQTACCWLH